MTTFDAKTYRDSVLKPYSRGEQLEQLREALAELQRDPKSERYVTLDLNELFAVPTPVSDAELTQWRGKIEPALNRAARLPAAMLLKQLLEILETQGKPLTTPAFWGGLQAKKRKALEESLNTGIKQLRSEYPLDVVGLEDLKSRLTAIGVTGLTDGSITTVAQQHGLSVYPEVQLPTGGLPPSIEPVWRSASKHTEFRSMAEIVLLHRPDDFRGVTFIDRLGTATGPLSVGDVEQARLKSEQGRDTDALQDAQKLLGMVKEYCTTDDLLHSLIFTSVAELASAQLARRRPQLVVRDGLVDIGFESVDASRLVAALSVAGGSAAGPRIGVDTVREQLSRGELAEAERTLNALSSEDEPERDALIAQVAALQQRKQQALTAYQAALTSRDFVSARRAITEAITIDQGDESLPPLRDSIPPATPRSFSLTVDGPSVSLSWAPDAQDGITYTVVRSADHLPSSVRDGDELATGLEATEFTDPHPAVGSLMHYGLFATRDGTSFSDGATAQVTVLPAPTAFAAVTDQTSTQLNWTPPRGAAGTLIIQVAPDGQSTEIEVNQGASLHVPGLTTGATYSFTARSWYLLSSGREFSAPVSLSVVPRGAASKVSDLEVTAETAGEAEVLVAEWTAIDGFTVELWEFPRHASLPEGSLVSASELTALKGSRMVPLPGGTHGARTIARFAEVNEVVRIAPLTVTDTGYLVGYSVITGSAPRATKLVTELFGDELRVSWDWPAGDYVMELGWQERGQLRTRRVTKARYRSEGGAKIVDASSVSDLTIATVVRVDGDEWVSSPSAIPLVDTQDDRFASYDIRLKRGVFGGKITCHITAESPATGFVMSADVVLKRGSVMPYDASQGSVVAQIDLDFTDTTTVEHTLTLDRTPSPYWVCVFSRDGSRLDPPPTTNLKG